MEEYDEEDTQDEEMPEISEDMNRAEKVIVSIFKEVYEEGKDSLPFNLGMVRKASNEYIGEDKNTNDPDIMYRFKTGRSEIPDEIKKKGEWVVKSRSGQGNYEFVKLDGGKYLDIPSHSDFEAIEVLESTPDVVLKYSSDDEQSLLSRLQYSRLLGTFLKLTVHHLQSHVQTSVQKIGQVEVDDLYVGVDKEGEEYVIPVEAKNKEEGERLSVIQLHAMNEFARQKFPDTTARPIGVKLNSDGSITVVEINSTTDIEEIKIKDVKKYRMVKL